jgi:hypothetical protein
MFPWPVHAHGRFSGHKSLVRGGTLGLFKCTPMDTDHGIIKPSFRLRKISTLVRKTVPSASYFRF